MVRKRSISAAIILRYPDLITEDGCSHIKDYVFIRSHLIVLGPLSLEYLESKVSKTYDVCRTMCVSNYYVISIMVDQFLLRPLSGADFALTRKTVNNVVKFTKSVLTLSIVF